MASNKDYIPALKYNSLTRFFDFLIQKFLKEKQWKTYLIQSLRSIFLFSHNLQNE